MDNYDYLFKCVAVGDGGCGKTALVVRFSQGFFQENYKLTIGVEFAVKTIHINNHNVKLQIWDTGGQERFQYVRPLYYKGSMGCIILFDLTNRESFDHIPKWMDEVKKESGSIPMLLVGNKKDLVDQRVISRNEAEEVAKDLNMFYVESSAKSGDGVGDVFGILALLMIGEDIPPAMLGGSPSLSEQPNNEKTIDVESISKKIPQPIPVFAPKDPVSNKPMPSVSHKPKPAPIYSSLSKNPVSNKLPSNPFNIPKIDETSILSLGNSKENITSEPQKEALKKSNDILTSSIVEEPDWFSPKTPVQNTPIQKQNIPKKSEVKLPPVQINSQFPSTSKQEPPTVKIPPKPSPPSFSSEGIPSSISGNSSEIKGNPFLAQSSKSNTKKPAPFTSPDFRNTRSEKKEPKIIKPTQNYSFFDSPKKPNEFQKSSNDNNKSYSFLDSLPAKQGTTESKSIIPKKKTYSFFDAPSKPDSIQSNIKKKEPKTSWGFMSNVDVNKKPIIPKSTNKESRSPFIEKSANQTDYIPSFLKKTTSGTNTGTSNVTSAKSNIFGTSHSVIGDVSNKNMIECPNCGAKLNKNFKFCNKCGSRTK
ncbi:GTP-binding protein [Candidatus Lokiarchaeum ossiferum]|uniref:GTP-binding protein n=1 Tax=Candidatus Lokiarchaeum ossiferum TaxID=2951803 RepID=UPI00352DE027